MKKLSRFLEIVGTYEAGSDQPDGLRRWEALRVERVKDVVGKGQCSDGIPQMRKSLDGHNSKKKAKPVGIITTSADHTYKKAGSPPKACDVDICLDLPKQLFSPQDGTKLDQFGILGKGSKKKT